MFSFTLVVKKPITISEYPSSPSSPHAAALKQLTYLVFKTLSPLEIKRRIGSTLFHKKTMTNIDRNILL